MADLASARADSDFPRQTAASDGGVGEPRFGASSRSWASDRASTSATAYLALLAGALVLTLAALIGGLAGSPNFSIGLAFGVGIGAVPYLLFVALHAGSSRGTDERPQGRRRMTQDEWQRVFGTWREPSGEYFRRASSGGGHAGANGADMRPDPAEAVASAYSLLGLSPDASIREIRAAYYHLAHRYHPDKAAAHGEAVQESEQRMKALNAAYALIRERRRSSAGSDQRETGSPSPAV